MIPVYQSIVDTKTGDCFPACLASILEIELSEVPNFWIDNEGHSDIFINRAYRWLEKEYGLSLITIQMQKMIQTGDDLRFIGCPPKVYCIATCDSPNFVDAFHCVVAELEAQNINIVHDPNPTGKPISIYDIRFVDLLVPLNFGWYATKQHERRS